MTRGATLFSGGRGVELLLKDDIDFQFAVEFDPQIAAVGAQLGGHTFVSDVRLVDYAEWGALDYLHASPVCKNASQAKTDGEETATDIETAQAVVRCLEATQPSVFTLENVWGYRTFEAFRRICQALDRGGYMWHFEHLNAADFGVPQTRRRLILRASRGLLPTLPPAVPWVGWYAAIEDLIPTLPESKFAPWQEERLPTEIKDTILVYSDNTIRAWLIGKDYNNRGDERGLNLRPDEDPAFTITERTERGRAWLDTGRVVKMTPRALARFQSVPDWYVLPEKNSLACTVIGNMMPPLMMSKIVRQLI